MHWLLQVQTQYTRSSRYTRTSPSSSTIDYVVYDYTDEVSSYMMDCVTHVWP